MPRSQTDTFMSGISDFSNTGHRLQHQSFGAVPPPMGMSMDRPKFSNRMAVDETEEWEMEETKDIGYERGSGGAGGHAASAHGSGSGGGSAGPASIKEADKESLGEADSPTTAVSGMGSEINLVNKLGKDDHAR